MQNFLTPITPCTPPPSTVTDVNVTAWQGIAAALPPGAAVYAPGCEGAGCTNETAFPAAVAAAAAARVVVFVGGLDGSQVCFPAQK